MRAADASHRGPADRGVAPIGGCGSADDRPATSANTSGDRPGRVLPDRRRPERQRSVRRPRIGADPAEADVIVDDGMTASRAVLRVAAARAGSARTERYVQVFEDFERLMRDTGYDPDPRDYAELQTRTTRARLEFTAAAEAVCGPSGPEPAPT